MITSGRDERRKTGVGMKRQTEDVLQVQGLSEKMRLFIFYGANNVKNIHFYKL